MILSRTSRLKPNPIDKDKIITTIPKITPSVATLITGPDNFLRATNNSKFKVQDFKQS